MPLPTLPTFLPSLLQLLDSRPHPKHLILDPCLASLFSFHVSSSTLKSHGVHLPLPTLATLAQTTPLATTIFIIQPTPQNIRIIAEYILKHKHAEYILCCTPRRSLIAERILEEKGVYGEITIAEFHTDWSKLEEDLWSLEIPQSFGSLMVNQDTTQLLHISRAITRLEAYVGKIPRILARGRYSKIVANYVHRTPVVNRDSPIIKRLIIIDRSCDLVTPLCKQLTYEGLIADHIGIDSTFVELPTITPPTRVALNNTIFLYTTLRDMAFHQVGPYLHKHATRLNAQYDEGKRQTNIQDLKEFVGKLGGIRDDIGGLKIHTHIAEQLVKFTTDHDFARSLEIQQSNIADIQDITKRGLIWRHFADFLAGLESAQGQEYIEELMYRGQDLWKVLSLLCLWSLTAGGLKPKIYDFFWRELVLSYGIQTQLSLHKLSEAGMLTLSTNHPTTNFSSLRKQHRLISDRDEMSYAYAGYVPLSVKLIEEMIDSPPGSWEGLDLHDDPNPPSGTSDGMTMIMFVGGITHAEATCLRSLFKKRKGNNELLIATTKMIHCKSVLQEIIAI